MIRFLHKKKRVLDANLRFLVVNVHAINAPVVHFKLTVDFILS